MTRHFSKGREFKESRAYIRPRLLIMALSEAGKIKLGTKKAGGKGVIGEEYLGKSVQRELLLVTYCIIVDLNTFLSLEITLNIVLKDNWKTEKENWRESTDFSDTLNVRLFFALETTAMNKKGSNSVTLLTGPTSQKPELRPVLCRIP